MVACQSDPAASGKAEATNAAARPVASPLETRVLARHDSLMIITDRLFDLRRRLAARRAGLLGTTSAGLIPRLDSATVATLRADNAMTDWMHDYRRPAAATSPDSAAVYFEQQLQLLDHVDLLTRRALDSATVVLGALPATR